MRLTGSGVPAQSLGSVGDTYGQDGGAEWEKLPGDGVSGAYWDLTATAPGLVPTGPQGARGDRGLDGTRGRDGQDGGTYTVSGSQSNNFNAGTVSNTVYRCDTSSTAFTATLPSPASGLSLSFLLTAGGSLGNLLTVSGTGLTAKLVKNRDAITVIGDGAAWQILQDSRQAFGVRVSKSGTQSIPNSAVTALTWDTETYDDAAMHSTSSNTSRLICPVDGVYCLSFFIAFIANTTGLRQVLLNRNGGGTQEFDDIKVPPSSGETHVVGVYYFHATAADYFEVSVFQSVSPSAALNVSATNTYASLSLVSRD